MELKPLGSFVVLLLLTGVVFAHDDDNEHTREHAHANDDEVAPMHESITIVAGPLGPSVEADLSEVLRKTLFSRDDQILQILGAGINAGQHEGGGKSLEIRRYGFNLDHGGAGGGLRITVDNIAQNYGTQGHGQGYVGALKSLTPELIEDVTVIAGPFRAEHGDFSGLGVVQIRLRESMPDEWTVRLQGGSFNSKRAFVAWSPNLARHDALLAYEGTHSDGPFVKPLDHVRHNVTGNYMWRLGEETHFGVKINGGTNRFNSSGQIPTDEVAAGRLDRFGALSPGDGGTVEQGRVAAYFRKDFEHGAGLRGDVFVERSLFDLYSNFTFQLVDPVLGDAIQQHDSRLSQGADIRYEKPWFPSWGTATLAVGGSLLNASNLVDLRRAPNRDPVRLLTAADAHVVNSGAYLHQELGILGGRVQLTGGLRWDAFRFAIQDRLEPAFSNVRTAVKLQPKASLTYSPWPDTPLSFFYKYGRGIASLDARGVARRPDSPPVSTTDFQQWGWKQTVASRWSLMADMFLIRQSNQLVYVPDDGTIDFTDPSQSFGFEIRSALDLTNKIRLDGSITKVLNAYLRETNPRVYVDRAPYFVAEAAVTAADLHGWSGSLRMRAINHYRLDGRNPSVVGEGNTVFDLAVVRRLHQKADLSFAVDNLFNRDFWETQNYFLSRLPGQPATERIHATAAYGRTLTVGLTLRFGGK